MTKEQISALWAFLGVVVARALGKAAQYKADAKRGANGRAAPGLVALDVEGKGVEVWNGLTPDARAGWLKRYVAAYNGLPAEKRKETLFTATEADNATYGPMRRKLNGSNSATDFTLWVGVVGKCRPAATASAPKAGVPDLPAPEDDLQPPTPDAPAPDQDQDQE